MHHNCIATTIVDSSRSLTDRVSPDDDALSFSHINGLTCMRFLPAYEGRGASRVPPRERLPISRTFPKAAKQVHKNVCV